MPYRPITNFYISPGAAMPSSLPATGVFPGERHESHNIARSCHSRKRSYDVGTVHHNYDAPTPCVKKDRRRTIDCALTRPPLTPRSGRTHQVTQILPQRTITPGPTTRVQSIWFRSENEHPDLGVSLADIVDNGAEGLVTAPEDRVFQGFGCDYDEIQFSILWPGYGYISWIASIPTNFREESGRQCGSVTRGMLAVAVAEHFRAFMTNHSHLRFPHPDPRWKIGNDQENGIRFENLRLTRLFSYKDEIGKFSSWQAEILVVSDHSAYTG